MRCVKSLLAAGAASILSTAAFGKLADYTSIAFVYQVCAFLPAIGLLAVFLPKMPTHPR